MLLVKILSKLSFEDMIKSQKKWLTPSNLLRGAQLLSAEVANYVTVFGGVTVVAVVIEPEILRDYLDKISNDVSVIAESIPVWPILSNYKFEFLPPQKAELSLDIVNPRNLVVHDYLVEGKYSSLEGVYSLKFDGPELVPPNEEVSYVANIIREPWFFEAGKEFDFHLCLSGEIEGSGNRFLERRVYRLSVDMADPRLTRREFELDAGTSC